MGCWVCRMALCLSDLRSRLIGKLPPHAKQPNTVKSVESEHTQRTTDWWFLRLRPESRVLVPALRPSCITFLIEMEMGECELKEFFNGAWQCYCQEQVFVPTPAF